MKRKAKKKKFWIENVCVCDNSEPHTTCVGIRPAKAGGIKWKWIGSDEHESKQTQVECTPYCDTLNTPEEYHNVGTEEAFNTLEITNDDSSDESQYETKEQEKITQLEEIIKKKTTICRDYETLLHGLATT